MSAERPPLHERVAAALDSAGDLTGAALLAHVERECADDPEVRAEVRALMGFTGVVPVLDSAHLASAARAIVERAHDEAALRASADGARTPEAAREVPPSIGPYRVVRVVGEGGMGVVYEAEQQHPRRRVAVKVIAPGVASRAAAARFRNEAQILGTLKHPGVAQVFEAGQDAGTGWAFLAMEFVEGPGLLEFSRARGLGPREVADLVARVCDAVHHAHQKGVIHRDLKPSNILVESSPEGTPQPKVLDFGVAKLVRAESTGATLALDAGRIVGTLGYMSPEALEGRPELVDTRSDVYSLGVILYELLAGEPPIDVRGLSITQAVTRVRSTEPRPLSRPDRAVARDLDAIARQALAKEPEHRYASAAELGADLRRFLADQPVLARGPGTLYAARKFARRNAGLTSAAALALASLVGALVYSRVQFAEAERARGAEVVARGEAQARFEAEQEARSAEQEQRVLAQRRLEAEQEARLAADRANQTTELVRDFLIRDIVGAAAPENLGYEAKVLDAVNAAEARVAERFAGRPEQEGEIRKELSRLYHSLGVYDKALSQIDRAVELIDASEARHGERMLSVMAQRTTVLGSSGRFEEAAAYGRAALARFDTIVPEWNDARLSVVSTLGNALQATGSQAEARKLLERGVVVAAEHLPEGHDTRRALRQNLMATLYAMNDVEAAIVQMGPYLEETTRALGPAAPGTLLARNNYINALVRAGRNEEAVALARGFAEVAEQTFPPKHPLRANANLTVAGAFNRAGLRDEAWPYALRARELFVESIGEFRWETEIATARVRSLALLKAERNGAWWILESIRLRLMMATAGELPSVLAVLRENAPRAMMGEGDAGALALLRHVADLRDEMAPMGHERRARFLAHCARAAAALGDLDLAGTLIQLSRGSLDVSLERDDIELSLTAAEAELAEARARTAAPAAAPAPDAAAPGPAPGAGGG